MLSSNSWTELSDRPRLGDLRASVEHILDTYGDEVLFVVLFGSMARGDFSQGSDFDLLVAIDSAPGERFLDRLYRFGRLAEGPVDVLVYDADEIERMWQDRHAMLLEALADGVVLHDTGAFARLRAAFIKDLSAGAIRRAPSGWDFRV